MVGQRFCFEIVSVLSGVREGVRERADCPRRIGGRGGVGKGGCGGCLIKLTEEMRVTNSFSWFVFFFLSPCSSFLWGVCVGLGGGVFV